MFQNGAFYMKIYCYGYCSTLALDDLGKKILTKMT